MFGMIVVCWFINGLRLRLLLAGRAGKLGQLQSVGIIMASEFAFCATPGGSGGPLTLMALLARAACARHQRGVRGRPVGRPDVLPLRPRCDPDLCPQPFAEPEHGIEPDLQRGIPGRPVRRRGNADPLPAPGDPLQRAGSSAARRVIAQAPALGPQDPAFPHCPATACACRNDACWRSSFSAVRTGCCASACST